MANKTISCSLAGSGKTSYGEYASMLYLGGGYRGRISFNCGSIPAGSTVTAIKVYLTHSSSVYAANQGASFSASSSGNWSYSSSGGASGTSSKSSGNTYVWNLSSSLGQAMVHLRSGYLHVSSSDIQARPYSGVSVNITYTEAVSTYDITLSPGRYGYGSSQTLTKTHDVALQLPGAIFTRSGYTQTGWSTSDGGSKVYELNGYYNTDASITLYPYWEAEYVGPTTYTVTCRPGANGTGSVSYYTKTEGVALQLPGAIFTRSGYTQTGWSTSDGGSKAYELNGYYNTDASITLYPYWKKDVLGLPVYRWDGTRAVRCNMYRWDGTSPASVYVNSRYDGGEKNDILPK